MATILFTIEIFKVEAVDYRLIFSIAELFFLPIPPIAKVMV